MNNIYTVVYLLITPYIVRRPRAQSSGQVPRTSGHETGLSLLVLCAHSSVHARTDLLVQR